MQQQNHDGLDIPSCQIRAVYDATTIRVYQAYSNTIADAALKKGTFISPPFKMDRMTWVKPSFLWMMYRAGWGLKDEGQQRILAIDITRAGFELALSHGCLSHADNWICKADWLIKKVASPVRIQWDPERNLLSQAMKHRTIQVGLSKNMVDLYVNKWIQNITDITPLAHKIHSLVQQKKIHEAELLLPKEIPYHSI